MGQESARADRRASRQGAKLGRLSGMPAGGDRLTSRPIDRVADFLGKRMAPVAGLPALPVSLDPGNVTRNFPCELAKLTVQRRKEENTRYRNRSEDQDIDGGDRRRQRKNELPPSHRDGPAQPLDQGSDEVREEHRENQQKENACQAVQRPQDRHDSQRRSQNQQIVRITEGPAERGASSPTARPPSAAVNRKVTGRYL